jgi:hypothetical protein
MASDKNLQFPLRIHVKFEYLTAAQHAEICNAAANIYDALANDWTLQHDLYMRLQPNSITPIWATRITREFSVLCTEFVATGNSLDIAFNPNPRKWMPEFVIVGEEAKLLFPQWTATAIITGTLILTGLTAANLWYDTLHKARELNQPDPPAPRLSSPTLEQVGAARDSLYARVVNQPNILSLEINGIACAKSEPVDTPLGRP